MMRILITGATGFVGQNFIKAVSSLEDYKLICVVRDLSKAKELFGETVELVATDNLEILKNYDFEYVLHLASCLTSRDDAEAIKRILDANIVFGTRLLDAIRDKRNLRFINLGSFAEYRYGAGKPNAAYFYTATKQAFRPILDYYADICNWSYIHLIPYTIYGGINNQKKLIDYVIDSLDAKESVSMSPGYQVSDFIHVDDLIDCIRYFIDNPQKWENSKGEEYHVGTGVGTSIRELAHKVELISGKKCNIKWGGRSYRERDVMHAVAPIGKLLDFGWKAKITLDDGIKRYFSKTVILGAGIAGLGASYSLHMKNQKSIVFEKNSDFGGLCGSFTVDGFTFDKFIHLSFTESDEVNSIFFASSPEYHTHVPSIYNLYNGIWIKHPAQNNLFPLSQEEKDLIIKDFLGRKSADDTPVNNYEDWLRLQFGDYFAEHFPMVYTRKYWMKEAKELRTEWVGQRVYQPSVDEVIAGSKTTETPNTYYAKEMRYPKTGGYKQFLKSMADVADIRYNKEVTSIDTTKRTVSFADSTSVLYNRLISSLPLPEMVKIVKDTPRNVIEAANKLECTCGYHVSIALKTKNIPPYLWWYIYDEDNLSARVHSPSMKSLDNAPEGCSSLQMEVYCKHNQYTEDEIKEKTVGNLIKKGIIKEEDILFVHLGYEKYANVIFTEPIYESRKIVRDYLSSVGIETIGRFGEWDYLWSDQSLLSGLSIKG